MSRLKRLVHVCLPRSVKPRRILRGPARGAIANIDFRVDAGFFFGLHEPSLHSFYEGVLKKGMSSFDVGMYRGWDALAFHHLTGSRVVSFDGNPRCINMAASFLGDNVSCIQLVHAYLSDGTDENLSIDAAAERFFSPDFVKIDVEGAEAKVIAGARKLLSERGPALVIETHGAEVERTCIDLLEDMGYTPRIVDGTKRGWLSEGRTLAHNRWIVCEGRE